MKPWQKKGFIIVVILQFLFITGMIIKQKYILSKGTEVFLKCEPVDPRSLFSGDYVNLNYKISSIKLKEIKYYGAKNYSNGKKVYVALEKSPENKFHRAAAISDNIDKLKNKYKVIIRGIVQNVSICLPRKELDYYDRYTIDIRYGIETYYVPQNQGKKIEKYLNKVYAQVSILASGVSSLKNLYLNGKKIEFR
mgnify:CR=1 FL=1